ncbi:hypothetical protein CVD25_21885 [Bacillus canaveralius]|uniref:YetF C-terminal domain-containing protein n=1 Tax=Bacillus canaveralius TaxID=1403243 RepID=A0A2N5GH11_9BACI|nr:DUF421 domain-containing protein [Bacillus canaveralius]PLR80060.1 hypothetical protein CU635_19840 [Bacillus canaveralius]PLR89043.1 hypothetical protein CVD25_21885 [Bacillus canaveralius]
MEEYLAIIFRTLFVYTLILFIFRLMGKREIGELSILDLVVFIMIAELAVVAIEDPKDPLIDTILPMGLLMVVQIGLAFISLKSKKFRDLIDGRPSVIINKGKIDEKAMKQQRYNFDDLMLQLREKHIRNIADVKFAILEPSGQLSVFEKSKDAGQITIPLIVDGVIQAEHLATIDKTSLWLRQELRKRGYKDVKKISFCSFQNGKFFIDTIDE